MTYRASRGSKRQRTWRLVRSFLREWRRDRRAVERNRLPGTWPPPSREGALGAMQAAWAMVDAQREPWWLEYAKHGAQSGDGWSGSIGGACPVQGEGTVDGFGWYFRARYENWRFEVSTPSRIIFRRHGELAGGRYSASWIGCKHAWSLIRSCISEFRRSATSSATAPSAKPDDTAVISTGPAGIQSSDAPPGNPISSAPSTGETA